jgi:hypothetical protein
MGVPSDGDYAIVHFATHGALTGQLKGWARTGPDPDATTQGHQRPSPLRSSTGGDCVVEAMAVLGN